MSTHNIGFYEDLKKLSLNYHQIRTLFLLLHDLHCLPFCPHLLEELLSVRLISLEFYIDYSNILCVQNK